jgi:hypothetical protein
MTGETRDPGTNIGQEAELAAERIPGGVQPDDERVAANSSKPGVPGEPGMERTDDGDQSTEFDRHREAGQAR